MESMGPKRGGISSEGTWRFITTKHWVSCSVLPWAACEGWLEREGHLCLDLYQPVGDTAYRGTHLIFLFLPHTEKQAGVLSLLA